MRGSSVDSVEIFTSSASRLGPSRSRLALNRIIWIVVPVSLCLSGLRFAAGQTATGSNVKTPKNITVCRSTAAEISHTGPTAVRYNGYREKYTNCTYLDGSLEIVFLEEEADYDLSFLENIREVTGYVLMVAVNAKRLPLTNLRIIRGQEAYLHDGVRFSIYIALNYRKDAPGVGLKELGFVSLREVLQGHVFFHDNPELCHDDTIEWHDILPVNSSVVYNNTIDYAMRRRCDLCHKSCKGKDNKRHCWGPGPGKCQILTKIGCSPQCDGRCMGDQVKDCCAQECAVGCTGPTKADCLACKQFENDGLCELACPPREIYVKENYTMIANPDFKYSYGSLCVKSCPNHLIASVESCALECDAGFVNVNGKCEKCIGPCPKKCDGCGEEGVNAANIESFRNCTIIQGNIRVLLSAFIGDDYHGIEPMTVDQLSALESIQEVSEFIQIQAHHSGFTNLSFLRDLRVVHGRKFIEGMATSFQIFDTSLESLDLVSLTSIGNGNIVVYNNSRLCFADTINWSGLVGSRKPTIYVQENKNPTECANSNAVCAKECSSNGCWGPRDDQCFLECANFRLEQRCISSCSALPLIYKYNDTECRRCHPECKSNCTGNLSRNCDECLNVKDGPYCVSTCPETKYPDHNNICQFCDSNCDGGCTGSRNSVGPGACNSCAIGRYIVESSGGVVECLAPGSECRDGYYKIANLRHEYGSMKGKQGCFKCHSECLRCDGPNNLQSCLECRHYRQERECVAECSIHHYLSVNKTSSVDECLQCHPRCLKCTGPTEFDCVLCKEYLVYLNPLNRSKGFECMETCPDVFPDKIDESTESDDAVIVCYSDEINRQRKQAIISGCVVAVVLLIPVFIVIIVVVVRKRSKTQANNIKMAYKISGFDDRQQLEPVSPSGAKPDLSKIRIIKESELRRGGILGSGAFGTVFKGLWVPENEDCKMIVAIKVLSEGTTPNQNEELISEARIMASVENEYCIRILAFCMASQMMIVTPLMHRGCLLDLVRSHKKCISSKQLLRWCSQIAQGMDYLEQINIVHRDLAARNVLVESYDHIRITDFGLSKLLDYNQNVVTHTGGKMPIKWLALESIQHKLFTHKSDVWGYGVTLWELFTYGKRPYENIEARSIPEMLDKGERLPQPSMCTIDVYMILIKCWVLELASRPTFKYLANEFEKMSNDSSRYLIIENDGKTPFPNHQYDEKAVLRSLSVTDPGGPENIVSPDDYIKPISTVQTRSGSSASDWAANSEPGIRRTKRSRKKDKSSPDQGKEQSNGDRHQSFRYCSDPCKAAMQVIPPYRGNKVHDYGNYPAPNHNGDDYLLPRQMEPPVNYLDLSNDTDSDNQLDPTSDPVITSCISNPEYFDMPDASTHVHSTPGLPQKRGQGSLNSKQYFNELDDERKKPLLWNKASQ